MYDFLIVGAGLYGSTFARVQTDLGKKCLVIDKRSHIGGNCYSEIMNNIHIHMYGPHCLHSNNDKVWNFVNRFARFRQFQLNVKATYDKIYSLPFNLNTFYEMWGVKTPKEAQNKIKTKKEYNDNLEDFAISQVGEEIYKTFIYGYTKKQWHKEPKDLPSSIIKRIPIRYTFNNNYFNDKYQGIPEDGYTSMFENMLAGIDIELNADFKDVKINANKIIYTGGIDEYYDYKFGKLEYLSLKFNHQLKKGDFQGCPIMNYTSENVPYTRIIEHKHFLNTETKYSIITYEYPMKDGDPYYPVCTKTNIDLYNKYKEIPTNVLFRGRLGSYLYQNMDTVIENALEGK